MIRLFLEGNSAMIRSTNMNAAGPSNPLHGITLETMLNQLVIHYGWEEMGNRINVRCFQIDPSIKSALKFLRTTPWARTKVERLYLQLPKPE